MATSCLQEVSQIDDDCLDMTHPGRGPLYP